MTPVYYRYKVVITGADHAEVVEWCRQHLGPWPNGGTWCFRIEHGPLMTWRRILIHTNDAADHALVTLTWG